MFAFGHPLFRRLSTGVAGGHTSATAVGESEDRDYQKGSP